MRIADLQDVVITGITGSEESKMAEFDIIFQLNSIGKAVYVGPPLQHAKKQFRKYDDGWRIER